MLTISEVNALLKRYVEGQRQDDPNYQVPRRCQALWFSCTDGSCSHLMLRVQNTPSLAIRPHLLA